MPPLSKSSEKKRNIKNSNDNTITNKLWGGRFAESVDADMWAYSKSIQIDNVLAKYDILGGIAHVRMLKICGHLKKKEAETIESGLVGILKEYKQGKIEWDMSSEDIHSNIESLLYQRIGDVAGKLHTGRSRNDQVAVDLHMYVREHIYLLVTQLTRLIQCIVAKAETHIDTIIPGYTHMQRAEPIRFAHHLLAYVGMFGRDTQRLCSLWNRVNISPLGAGAFSGSPVPIDSSITAKLLMFDGIYENSIDAVSDRDFGVELLSALSLIQMHISKLSEELVLWTSHEFAFITLNDRYCTGSSMMPQKKNPDLAELARGKTGSVYGNLISLLTMLKGLPLSYNRDLQEDKKPIFESISTTSSTLVLFEKLLASIQVNKAHTHKEATQDFSNATEIANYLVRKGVPFRNAHETSGLLVKKAIEQNMLLSDLSLQDFKQGSSLIEEDIYKDLDIIHIIEKHKVRGGTARTSVLNQICILKKELKIYANWLIKKESYIQLEISLFKNN